MKALSTNSENPFAYRANSVDQVLLYLTRSVNNIPFASNEELYAAALIDKMRDQIQFLEYELKTVYRKYQHEKHNHLYEQDSLRLEYCIRHGIILHNQRLYCESDSEAVIDNNYRAAIDNLMGIKS